MKFTNRLLESVLLMSLLLFVGCTSMDFSDEELDGEYPVSDESNDSSDPLDEDDSESSLLGNVFDFGFFEKDGDDAKRKSDSSEANGEQQNSEQREAVESREETVTNDKLRLKEDKEKGGFFSALFGRKNDETDEPQEAELQAAEILANEDDVPTALAEPKKDKKRGFFSRLFTWGDDTAETSEPSQTLDEASDEVEEGVDSFAIDDIDFEEDLESELPTEELASSERSSNRQSKKEKRSFFSSLFGSVKEKVKGIDSFVGDKKVKDRVVLIAPSSPYTEDRTAVPEEAQELYDEALAAINKDRTEQAVAIFKDIIQSYPHFSGPYVNLGIIYREQGNLDQAASMFTKAIAANRNNLEAYNQLGYVYRLQGKFADAEKAYADSLSVWPNYTSIHYNLAILYELYLGRLDKALFHFETYQALQAEEDRKVKGWIVDLKRRIKKQGA